MYIKRVFIGFKGLKTVDERVLRILSKRILSRECSNFMVVERNKDYWDFDGCYYYLPDFDRLFMDPVKFGNRGNKDHTLIISVYDFELGDNGVFSGVVRVRVKDEKARNISTVMTIGTRSRCRVDDSAELSGYLPKFEKGTKGSYGDMDVDRAYVDALFSAFGASKPLFSGSWAVGDYLTADAEMMCKLCCTKLGRDYDEAFAGSAVDAGTKLLGSAFLADDVDKGVQYDTNPVEPFKAVCGFLGMRDVPRGLVLKEFTSYHRFNDRSLQPWTSGFLNSNLCSWIYWGGSDCGWNGLPKSFTFCVVFCGDFNDMWYALPANFKKKMDGGGIRYGDWCPIYTYDGEKDSTHEDIEFSGMDDVLFLRSKYSRLAAVSFPTDCDIDGDGNEGLVKLDGVVTVASVTPLDYLRMVCRGDTGLDGVEFVPFVINRRGMERWIRDPRAYMCNPVDDIHITKFFAIDENGKQFELGNYGGYWNFFDSFLPYNHDSKPAAYEFFEVHVQKRVFDMYPKLFKKIGKAYAMHGLPYKFHVGYISGDPRGIYCMPIGFMDPEWSGLVLCADMTYHRVPGRNGGKQGMCCQVRLLSDLRGESV